MVHVPILTRWRSSYCSNLPYLMPSSPCIEDERKKYLFIQATFARALYSVTANFVGVLARPYTFTRAAVSSSQLDTRQGGNARWCNKSGELTLLAFGICFSPTSGFSVRTFLLLLSSKIINYISKLPPSEMKSGEAKSLLGMWRPAFPEREMCKKG